MTNFCKHLFLVLLLLFSANAFAQITLQTPNAESVLYVGKGKNQPLIVGLGGSEGGNAWTSDYWKKQETGLLKKVMHFWRLDILEQKEHLIR